MKKKRLSKWQNDDQNYVWHPFTQTLGAKAPIVITRGEGASVFDEDDNKYIDAIASWWVNIHGHANPYIAQKVSEQLNTLEHTIFADFTHPSAIELSKRLINILPNNQQKVFFSDNGSTAVEVALKMSFQYWYNNKQPKYKIVAIEGAYHGDTFGAMSVSGRSPFNAPFDKNLFDVEFIEFPDSNNIDKVFDNLEKIILSGEIAAFIFEPLLQGTAGMRMYDPEILDRLLSLCKSNNVLTIADEILTGFGRTGKNFATDYLRVNKPDIFCLSKGLTGGTMAMGITTCTEDIFNAFSSKDLFKTFFHGHSYTANPIACSAALASLDIFLSPECKANMERINKRHKQFELELEGIKSIEKVRVLGTVLAFDIVNNESTNYFNSAKEFVKEYFLEGGVLIRPLGNVIYLIPPYCITDEELNEVYTLIVQFCTTLT